MSRSDSTTISAPQTAFTKNLTPAKSSAAKVTAKELPQVLLFGKEKYCKFRDRVIAGVTTGVTKAEMFLKSERAATCFNKELSRRAPFIPIIQHFCK